MRSVHGAGGRLAVEVALSYEAASASHGASYMGLVTFLVGCDLLDGL